MARTTKKKPALTPEEKLEQALVPEAEQPYKVPENWCWVNWGSVGDFIAGSGFKNEYQGFTGYEIPFYKVGSLKNSDASGLIYAFSNTINEEIRSKLKATLIPPNSILFAKIGEAIKLNRRSVNRIACCIDNNMMAFVPKCVMRYAFYWSCGIDLYDYTNATTVPAIRKSDLEAIPFPLPPLPEQHRIVTRIESLFAKLDEAREKAQAVVDGFEDRKAAILHKAFTGELTEGWRRQNGLDFSSTWKNCSLGEYADNQYGYTEKSSHEAIGPKFLRITDIQDGQVSWGDVPYCKIDEELKSKYTLNVGDIVVARIGATTGKSYMVIDDVDAVYASYLIRVSVFRKDGLTSKYLYHYLQCPMYWQQITELSSGIAQPGVNGKKLKTLKLPIPTIEEQNQIVLILDQLIPIERQAVDSAEQVLDQIDTMKKSILARAFRGELGTNDPEEESAVELVRRVL